MHVRVIGFSASYPDPGTATSSYLVQDGDTVVLVDCGHGAVGRLRSDFDLRRISAVVVSHLHPDHFFDLVALRNCWYRQALPPVPLFAPVGARGGFGRLLDAIGFPGDYLGEFFGLQEIEPGDGFRVGNVAAATAAAHHHVTTLMLRIRAASGVELGYTADTGWFPGIERFFSGVDLLVAEATDHPLPAGVPDRRHLSPEEAGRLARLAGVGMLVVTHFEERLGDEVLALAAAAAGGVPVALASSDAVFSVAAAGMPLVDAERPA